MAKTRAKGEKAKAAEPAPVPVAEEPNQPVAVDANTGMEALNQPADATTGNDPDVIKEMEFICQLRTVTVEARQKLYDKAVTLFQHGAAMEDEVTLRLLDLKTAEIELAKAKLNLLRYRASGTITT